MKVVSKFFLLSSVMLALMFTSCSGDDGVDGLDGKNGIDGANGVPGIQGSDGVDGTNGADGANGAPGADGEDGNANAQAFYYDTKEYSGNNFVLEVPEFTEKVLTEDTILIYAKIGAVTSALPTSISGQILIEAYLTPNTATIVFFYNEAPYIMALGQIDAIKIIIIDSSSFVERSSVKSASTDVLSKLKNEGVDANDYDAVAAYFNL
tara:strand:+ start:16 stop:639 length:624 start_codon:yes stop_codon:yes gene_type:complete